MAMVVFNFSFGGLADWLRLILEFNRDCLDFLSEKILLSELLRFHLFALYELLIWSAGLVEAERVTLR